MDEDSLKIMIGRVSIIRNGGIRAILSISKTGSFSAFPDKRTGISSVKKKQAATNSGGSIPSQRPEYAHLQGVIIGEDGTSSSDVKTKTPRQP
jgi:hypothetical protein